MKRQSQALLIMIGLLICPMVASFLDRSSPRAVPALSLPLQASAVGWSDPTVISDGYGGVSWNTGESCRPAIATAADGSIHVVWDDWTVGEWGSDREIMHANHTASSGWSNVTVISDGYAGSYWNDGGSAIPDIAVDGNGGLHAVWHDSTAGEWGSDLEIMYANHTSGAGWSNATVISDSAANWNTADSSMPALAVDPTNNVHVVWCDDTDGPWGSDAEIMYAAYTVSSGWSSPLVISDGIGGPYWNTGDSRAPDIAVDGNDVLHVVWEDDTAGEWGSDVEIMYANYTSSWSNATVISDGHGGSYWNTGTSGRPAIAALRSDSVHVVWHDGTDGAWGTDAEIMHSKYEDGIGWSSVTIISDDNSGSYDPAIAIDENLSTIHVAWENLYGDYEVMHAFYNPSQGWSEAIFITDNAGDSEHVAITAQNGSAYAVWEDESAGPDAEIMCASFPHPVADDAICGFSAPLTIIAASLAGVAFLLIHRFRRSGREEAFAQFPT